MASSQLMRCQGQDDTTLLKLTKFYDLAWTFAAFSPQAFAHAHVESHSVATPGQLASSSRGVTHTLCGDLAPTFSSVESLDGNHQLIPLTKPIRAAEVQSVERVATAHSAVLPVRGKLATVVARGT